MYIYGSLYELLTIYKLFTYLKMKHLIITNSERTLSFTLPEEFSTGIESMCIVDEPSERGANINNMQIMGGYRSSYLQINDGVFIKHDEYLVKIFFSDIIYVEASRSYCYIHLSSGENLVVTYPMARLKPILPQTFFMQIHRSHIININYIHKIIGNIIHIGKFRLPISKSSMEQFKQRIVILERHK